MELSEIMCKRRIEKQLCDVIFEQLRLGPSLRSLVNLSEFYQINVFYV